MEDHVPMVNNGYGQLVPAMPTIVSNSEAVRVSREAAEKLEVAKKKKNIFLRHPRPEFRDTAAVLAKYDLSPEDFARIYDNLVASSKSN